MGDRSMKRRVALFAYYYPPLGGAGSQRALSLARHLPRLGWDVTVITPLEGVYGKDPSLGDAELPGVDVVRTGTWEPAVLLRRLRGQRVRVTENPGGAYVDEAELGVVGSAVRKVARRLLYFPDSARGWIRHAVSAALQVHGERPFDLVLSTSPPISAHVAAERFAEKVGLPLVLCFRDLWEEAVSRDVGKARDLLARLLARADRVVTVSKGYARSLSGVSGKATAVVYNGFEPEDLPSGDAEEVPGERVLIHAGTTYPGRQDFIPLCQAVRGLREEGAPLRLLLVGRIDPTTRGILAPFVAGGSVTLEAFQARREVLDRARSAAAVVVFAWSGGDAVSVGHIPAKLFEALALRRPVLLLADPGSEAESVAARAGVRALGSSDVEGLKVFLRTLVSGQAPEGSLPQPGALKSFERVRAAERMADVLRDAVESRPGRWRVPARGSTPSRGSGRKGRVAFFAYYYPPLGGAGSQRALSFARHLPGHGWEVTVFTPREGVYGSDPGLAPSDPPDVRVVRTGSWEPAVLLRRMRGLGSGEAVDRGGMFVEEAKLGPVGSALRGLTRRILYFPDSSQGWIRSAVSAARREHDERPFDIVLSSSPPVSAHVAAHRFASAASLAWVCDWRDPWIAHLAPGAPTHERALRLEKQLLGTASGVVAATDGVARILEARRGGGPGVTTVRNGFEPQDFFGGPPRLTHEFTVLHAGTTYGRDQDLAGFFRALSQVALGNEGVPLRARFLGKVDPYTVDLVKRHHLEGVVKVEGFSGHADAVSAMREADLLLLLSWAVDNELGRAVCPAKTYEYLAAQRPILLLSPPGGEAARLLGGTPGVSIAGFQAEDAIARTLHEALLTREDAVVPPPEAARPFTRAAQASVLHEVLLEALEVGGRRT